MKVFITEHNSTEHMLYNMHVVIHQTIWQGYDIIRRKDYFSNILVWNAELGNEPTFIDFLCCVPFRSRHWSASSGGHRLLDDVRCLVQAGEMVALMGPSGAGKTTLLNRIVGRPIAASLRIRHEPSPTSTVVAKPDHTSRIFLHSLAWLKCNTWLHM